LLIILADFFNQVANTVTIEQEEDESSKALKQRLIADAHGKSYTFLKIAVKDDQLAFTLTGLPGDVTATGTCTRTISESQSGVGVFKIKEISRHSPSVGTYTLVLTETKVHLTLYDSLGGTFYNHDASGYQRGSTGTWDGKCYMTYVR
jgi:hypothetical protein